MPPVNLTLTRLVIPYFGTSPFPGSTLYPGVFNPAFALDQTVSAFGVQTPTLSAGPAPTNLGALSPL